MIAPARRAALQALTAVERGAELPAALARSRDELADDRDRALAAAIITGALRWRAWLDFLIERHASRPAGALDDDILQILRLSVFQLLFLDRVPASAVVDDAVSLAKAQRKRSAAGFVNAVLRAISRGTGRIDRPEPPAGIATPEDREAAIEALSVTGSHPRWLVARWLDRLGLATTRQWVDFNNVEPYMTVRVNRSRATREQLASDLAAGGIETVPTPWAPDGLVVRTGNPLRTALAAAGMFLVQDEASQLVPLMVGARPGMRVLDACAAPGGKTLILVDRLGTNRRTEAARSVLPEDLTPSDVAPVTGSNVRAHDGGGVLVAADLRPRRLAVLGDLLRQHGKTAMLVQHDLARGVPFGAIFDRVLVDAPCTGLGTLRRDVDVRWRRTEADVLAAGRRQRAMLTEAAQVVGVGGRLVYATCSTEPEENEEVVFAFLEANPAFGPVPRHRLLADGVPDAILDPETGFLSTRPDVHGLENFFAAALQRV